MKKAFRKVAARLKLVREEVSTPEPHGYEVLRNPAANKSTAFTTEERDDLGLRGLLPHRVSSQDEQKSHVLAQLRRKTSDLEKYIYLAGLQERNERLFYSTALENIPEIMPLIYTPTVGEACREFSNIFRNPRGLYITPADKGKIREMLDNWPEKDVRAIVITDGQRILGLGDLGANGMGIPIGKLSLYSLCGGIDPRKCLPVMFDIGTNNDILRNDPLYLGYPEKRLEGAEYMALMDEFVQAVNDKFPKALIQFEDFLTPNAHKLLNTYRDKTLCFNDDIQGTAAVILSGIYASARAKGEEFKDQSFMFLGAGAAATGIADLIVRALEEEGVSQEEARKRIWLVDRSGVVTKDKKDMAPHHVPYAHDLPALSFVDAINELKPTTLIGVTGAPGTFTQAAVEAMAKVNERPVIFALSNPTSHSECTAEQAYEWTKGKVVFASGSPFAPVEYNGKKHRVGQGNNAYIFPGVGLGVIASGATRVTEEMFLAAAKTLANMVTEGDIESGMLFPPLQDIRKASLKIATAVAKVAAEQSLATVELPKDVEGFIKKQMYDPAYHPPAQQQHKLKAAPGL